MTDQKYRVVPVEPTDAQIKAMYDNGYENNPEEAASDYRAAINAAPDTGMVAVRRDDLLTVLTMSTNKNYIDARVRLFDALNGKS